MGRRIKGPIGTLIGQLLKQLCDSGVGEEGLMVGGMSGLFQAHLRLIYRNRSGHHRRDFFHIPMGRPLP